MPIARQSLNSFGKEKIFMRNKINPPQHQKQSKLDYQRSRVKQLKRLKRHLISKMIIANQSKDEMLARHYLQLCSQIERQLVCRKTDLI